MPNTASGIPYPLSTDAPNGAGQMQTLAAAVEGIFAAGGSVAYGYASTASFTSTTSFTNAISCNITVPAYWGGYRVFAIGHWMTATPTDNTCRIAIAGTADANSIEQTVAGGVVIGSATGTATGTVTAALQISGADGGASLFSSLQVIGLAVRNS